jgi:hypothetical protein
MTEETEQKEARITIEVINEDNGQRVKVGGGPGTPVRNLIREMYHDFGIEQDPADRLRCQASGEDVFQYADLHLREYVAQHCAARVWLFARPTGGAGR